jgi:hypothetical protein
MEIQNLSFKESDVASFAGLVVVVPAIVGALKGLFKKWIDGKEPIICVMVTYALGVTAKLTIPMAFGGVGWLVLLVSLIIVAKMAAGIHDFAVNKVIKGLNEADANARANAAAKPAVPAEPLPDNPGGA